MSVIISLKLRLSSSDCQLTLPNKHRITKHEEISYSVQNHLTQERSMNMYPLLHDDLTVG